jgi:hypothetical protein
MLGFVQASWLNTAVVETHYCCADGCAVDSSVTCQNMQNSGRRKFDKTVNAGDHRI